MCVCLFKSESSFKLRQACDERRSHKGSKRWKLTEAEKDCAKQNQRIRKLDRQRKGRKIAVSWEVAWGLRQTQWMCWWS